MGGSETKRAQQSINLWALRRGAAETSAEGEVQVDAVGELRVAQGNHIPLGGNLILLEYQHREHVNLARFVLHFTDANRLGAVA